MESTNKELVEELQKLNTEGRYDQLIVNALENAYHDYKSGEALPKMRLLSHLLEFPELKHLFDDIVKGRFSEEPDEEDKADMRKTLEDEGMGSLKEEFGL